MNMPKENDRYFGMFNKEFTKKVLKYGLIGVGILGLLSLLA